MTDRKYASAGDIPAAEFEDVELEHLNRKVRVRYLTTPEAGALSHLPDLADYTSLLMKLAQPDEAGDVDAARLTQENYKYQAFVAHIAVFEGEGVKPFSRCEDCGLDHPPSMWTVSQALRLHSRDTAAITSTALRSQTFGWVRPFLEDQQQSDSEELVATGASIPQTS